MNREWDGLMSILQRHLEFHEILLQMAEEKREVLVANEVDELLSILEREEGMIKQIKELEEERERSLRDLSLGEDRSFKDLLEKAPDQRREDLLHLRDSLLQIVEELKVKNESNAMLVNESLDLNEFSIQLFTNSIIGQTYSPGNSKKKEVSYRLFDEKA